MKYLSSFVVFGSALASLAASACTSSSSTGTNGHNDSGADGGASSTGGASGAGGARSGGATSTGGGTSTTGGGSNAGGSTSGGGSTSTGGTGTDGGTPEGGVNADPCTGTDPTEANETRDKATAYTIGATQPGCVATSTDHDFYEFTVPADVAGGYIQIALENVGDGYLDVHLYSASDNGEIGHAYAASRGQSVNSYAAVAKGQKYRIDVTDFSGFDKSYAYSMKVTYTAIADTFEPNDTKDTAKAITKGTPIDAFDFAGYTSAATPPETAYDDWYSVTLTTGTVTAKIENVPTDMYGDLKLFDSAGTEVVHEYGASQGASVTLTYAATAGNYYVKVGSFSSPPPTYDDKAAVTDHFTRKYKLTVSQ